MPPTQSDRCDTPVKTRTGRGQCSRDTEPGLRWAGVGDNGAANTLDFMVAAIIFIAGLSSAFGIYGLLIDTEDATGQANDQVAIRINERLVDDLFVDEVGETALNQTCVNAFFATETSTTRAVECGYGQLNGANESAYLASAVAVDSRFKLNLTIRDPSGPLYSMGEPVPAKGDVAQYHRTVTFQGTVAGRDYHILRVSAWEVG